LLAFKTWVRWQDVLVRPPWPWPTGPVASGPPADDVQEMDLSAVDGALPAAAHAASKHQRHRRPPLAARAASGALRRWCPKPSPAIFHPSPLPEAFMTSETTAKKDIQKLQRAIVDGLEDVKGQDIVVFNTEALSPLFERVIVASGTSNRQTKALAASVRDAVREAGFDKPRIEGEDNGEWIIVDCGQAVAHVMQPVIRQYYRLEEIWGAKPVRLKHGAPKPAEAVTLRPSPPPRPRRKGEVKGQAGAAKSWPASRPRPPRQPSRLRKPARRR
jgi:ribosome-associated protein